jgi:phage terminase large subunit
MYLYKEIFQTQVLLEDHAKLILELLKNEPKPKMIITDHAAQERKILEKYLKLPITLANKKINEGIQAVSSRLIVRDNGKPRIYLCENAVVHRDNSLEESKKPCSTLEEITGYVWNKEKDTPVDKDNHGMDAMRYMVAQLDLGTRARADRFL